MKRTIRIGSRDSKLAVAQTELLMKQIQTHHPELNLELITMKTTGDLILDRNLDQIGGKGLFVKELDKGLRDGTIDISVHSLKDMTMDIPEDIPLLAFSEREDPRDALILPLGKSEIDLDKPFGCSSARRRLQLEKLYGGVTIKGIRGNVLLRLDKVDSGDYAATVLACAGLNRIGLQNRISKIFTAEEMIPAAGQGILAVQGRAGEDHGYLTCIASEDSALCAQAERAFVRAMNGDCSSPIAAYATIEQQTMTLYGYFCNEELGREGKARVTGSLSEANDLGKKLAEIISDKIAKG
ncbi:MAG: hydroxymethylbilane synthase [Anaerofustis sp.]